MPKLVLITGTSQGNHIGENIARRFAVKGYKVIIAEHAGNADLAEGILNNIEGIGQKGHYVPLTQTNHKHVFDRVKEVKLKLKQSNFSKDFDKEKIHAVVDIEDLNNQDDRYIKVFKLDKSDQMRNSDEKHWSKDYKCSVHHWIDGFSHVSDLFAERSSL